jgi:hypothetical protein
MDDTPGVPARLRSTLFAVARYADEDGRGAYPSAAQVAWITGKSRPQATRDMADLAALGVLLPGDPGLVKDIRGDRRPNVYDLAMPRGASERAPSGESRRASERTSSGGSRRASERTSSGESRRASGDETTCIGLQTDVHLDAHDQVLKTSRTTRGRDGAHAPRDAPRYPQTQPARIAPPCPECGEPYTTGQLAADDFHRAAMRGDAGCIHPEAVR